MSLLPSSVSKWWRGPAQLQGRAGELFAGYVLGIQQETHRLFLGLFLVQYPAFIAVALLWSPRAWSGSVSGVHFHVWLAVVFGGLVTSLPVYLILTAPEKAITRHVIAAGQMLMSSLLIHLTEGRIESHFHIFGSLAILAFYRDLSMLGTATATILVDHGIRGAFFPQSIYGVLFSSNWRTVEHGFWAIFENIFLALSCLQGRAQLAEIALQQSRLETVNSEIEAAVQARTKELADMTAELVLARDRALEANRLKSDFLANVSHEIRTPMNGVVGFAELLSDTRLEADQREFVDTIRNSAASLLNIINDVLDFSKIEAGHLNVETLPSDLHQIAIEACELLSPKVAETGLELALDWQEDAPDLVWGDPGRLRQVLLNLINNALKFTLEGRVIVRASLSEPNHLRIEVADTGIGVPAEKHSLLFQKFSQADTTTTRKYGGTGLGLAISRELIEAMGGEIGFESEQGKGSTFWICLPVAAVPPLSGPAREPELAPLKVLLIDDLAENHRIVRRCLAPEVTVDAAFTAEQASAQMLAAAESGRAYDVVLVDERMPDCTATALAAAIRLEPRHGAVPLLLLSGQRAGAEDIERFRKAGFTDVVSKPLLRAGPLRRALLEATRIQRRCERVTTPVESSRARSQDCHILLAEDNVINQRLSVHLLKKLGCQVDVVEDGQQAVLRAAQFTYNLILMDCQMPVMDGFQATSELRGSGIGCPIVALTANAFLDDRDRCLAAGMDDYLTKPVDAEKLGEMLSRWIPQL